MRFLDFLFLATAPISNNTFSNVIMSVNRIGNSSKKKNKYSKKRLRLMFALNSMEDSIFISYYHRNQLKGNDNMKFGGLLYFLFSFLNHLARHKIKMTSLVENTFKSFKFYFFFLLKPNCKVGKK